MAKASIRSAKLEDIKVGAVLRMTYTDDSNKPEPTCASFSDCVISEVRGEGLNAMVFFSRVWCRFDQGKPVFKEETFSGEAIRFVGKTGWQVVINDRGVPENYAR